jgi:hypothetical protein
MPGPGYTLGINRSCRDCTLHGTRNKTGEKQLFFFLKKKKKKKKKQQNSTHLLIAVNKDTWVF